MYGWCGMAFSFVLCVEAVRVAGLDALATQSFVASAATCFSWFSGCFCWLVGSCCIRSGVTVAVRVW